ncbi:MAG: right-handed parallel beta-helix repeat-containing protein, partial [Anaerolineae bacterium]
ENPHLINEWYTPEGGTQDPALAAPIEVVTGSTTSGIVFTLKVGGAISGHVYQEDGVTPVHGSCFFLAPDDPLSEDSRPYCMSDQEGEYTIPGLYTGIYYLRTWADGLGLNPSLLDKWYTPDGGTVDPALAAPIDVITGSTASGITFTLGTECIVASKADSGLGTLRQCLELAEEGDTITFDPDIFPPDKPATITLVSDLPHILVDNVTIDGSSAGVIVEGSGFHIWSDGNRIQGLQIYNAGTGIEVGGGGSYNVISGNVLSGHGWAGVDIHDTGSMSNTVIGNLIGTDATGTVALGNGTGVKVRDGAQYNVIGGDTPAERNVISGSDGENIADGIDLGASSYNVVIGNYIGTDIHGTTALPNMEAGVGICCGASHNTIGGSSSNEHNIISGNGMSGVRVFGTGSDYNVIRGNYIGTDPTGTQAVPNNTGVLLWNGARYNVVGGTSPGEGNLISGNAGWGVAIWGVETLSNTVAGNLIGTDPTGMAILGNANTGVDIEEASHNIIGGDTPAERNVISGNDGGGLSFYFGAHHNTISGNHIGTNIAGTAALSNQGYGVGIGGGSSHNLIGGENGTPGGDCTGACNLISGNSGDGIIIQDNQTFTNTVRGNYIGTNAGGSAVLANDGYGIHIHSAASHNIIGGDTAGEGNLISGNASGGVGIGNGDSNYNLISGNYIGTDANGTEAIPNGRDGVSLWWNASWNTVGTRNTIAFNAGHGVSVDGGSTLYNTVTRNSIHGNTDQGIALSDGGNDNLSAPTVATFDPGAGTANGTALPGCTVEVFSDTDDGGRWFEGETVADGAGNWSFSKGDALAGPYVRATCTDALGNTSPFSLASPDTCPVVSSPADNGPGTLRQCLLLAGTGDTISFDTNVFPPTDPVSITLTSALPTIVTDSLTIDARNAGVIVDGSQIGATPEVVLLDDISLTVNGGANQIVNGDFSAGLANWEASDDGPGATRTLNDGDYGSAAPSLEWGVIAHSGESATGYTEWISATVGDNVEIRFWYRYGGILLSLDVQYPDDSDTIREARVPWQNDWTEGVIVETVPPGATAVRFSFVREHSEARACGLSSTADHGSFWGLQVVNFPGSGLILYEGAQHNLIGGSTPGERNIISGNYADGIRISDVGTMSNTVSGNFIGTDVSGTGARGNMESGVLILEGASQNLIGGDHGSPGGACSGACNLISGNGLDGIRIRDWGTWGNRVCGNYIGTDPDGLGGLGNHRHGILINDEAGGTLVGGGTEAQRNLISGNGEDGIAIYENSNGNVVSGNYVGTDVNGSSLVPNGYIGVVVASSAHNVIGGINGSPGGDCTGECNLVSGNDYGVEMFYATNITVTGNYIGTDVSGTTWLSSNVVQVGGAYNRIGGITPGERNVLAGPLWIAPPYEGPHHHQIIGNYVGVDATGTACIGQGWGGIGVGGSDHVVGGDTPEEGNRICGYDHWGIWVHGTDNVVGHNQVFGNGENGILTEGSDNLLANNEIHDNQDDGVEVRGETALRNTITENSIHDNEGQGIRLVDGGNEELGEPRITAVDLGAGTLSGTACAGCRVEVFSDDEDEGRVLEGLATAGGDGRWSFDKGSTFTFAHATATTTDGEGNTSEFSRPARPPLDLYVDGTAPAGGDGSPEYPFQTVGEALDASFIGDTIHIADGTYLENLEIDQELTLLGGYSGLGDPFWVRDPDLYETVLDGSGNPTIPGDWDSGQFGMPHVVWDAHVGEYKMYYTSSGTNHPFAIGLATSPDSIDWEKYPDNPILLSNPGTWEGDLVQEAYVRIEGPGTYKMWYDNGSRIGYATSTDGIHWDKRPDPVFEPAPGSWDSTMVRTPSVVWTGSEYLMAYEGDDGSWDLYAGVATSPDGITWTRYAGNPILGAGDPGAFDEYGIYRLDMAYDGSEYRMIYGGDGSGPLGLGIATSPNGFNWTRHPDNPVFGAGTEPWENWSAWSAGLLWDDPVWKLYYAGVGEVGHAIGLATASDGVHFVRDSEHNPCLWPGTPGQEGAPTVQVLGAGSVVLEDLVLTGGYYWDGGGLAIESAHVTLQGCSVLDNGAVGNGGGIQATAGSTLEVYSSVLANNAAGSEGGGLDAGDGTTVSMKTVTIGGNVSPWSAGLRLEGGSRARGDQVWIVDNASTDDASGGVQVENGSILTLTNALIAGNAGGAGTVTTSSTLSLTNATVAGNSRADGGGGIGVYDTSQATILNSILFYSGDWDLECDGTSTCLVESSDLEHSWTGPGNLSEDPLFVGRAAGDYHLQVGSPCIDTASAAYAPDHDIDGDSRPYDGDGDESAEPDMGADEYIPGTCTVDSTDDSGPGTLRACLESAQAGDTITFDPEVFPLEDPATIALTSGPLPEIWQGSLTLDAVETGVILDGSALESGSGLQIASSGNAVQGLQILYFPENGILLQAGATENLIGGTNTALGKACSGACNLISGNGVDGIRTDGGFGGNIVSGNFIGTDVTGTSTIPNGYYGVDIYSDSNLIGGSNATPGGACTGECNLISGNVYGVQAVYSAGNTIVGNYIGTDASGTIALGGGFMQIGGSYNRVGGPNQGERNVIAGMIFVAPPDPPPTHQTITGNFIGVDSGGTSCFGGYMGILVYGSDHVVGGATPEEGNLICGHDHAGISVPGSGNTIGHNRIFAMGEDGVRISGSGNLVTHNEVFDNMGHGVRVSGSSALTNTLTHNSIYANGGLGIDLEEGGNAELPAPILTALDMASGTVSGTACPDCTIEVFSDAEDEGRWYEGTVTADGGGAWSFAKGSPFTGTHVTATATDAEGNTSEFSGVSDIAVVGAMPVGQVIVDEAEAVRAELFNDGNQPVDGVPVTCRIEDPTGATVYDQTEQSDEIPAGTWAWVEF